MSHVEATLTRAMAEDDSKSATGEWVALLGFSQGAKICANLLLSQQQRLRNNNCVQGNVTATFHFGVLLAGRGPLTSSVTHATLESRCPLAKKVEPTEHCTHYNATPVPERLCMPTIHVHGTKDPGLELHRNLLKQYCDSESAMIVEWDGGHRVPIKTKDIVLVVQEIHSLARKLCVT